MHRGWPIVIGFIALTAGYLVIGSVYNMQTKGVVGLAALPHPEFWKSGYKLVMDGAYYTRSRLREGPDGGGTYEQLPAAVSGTGSSPEGVAEAQAELRSSGSSRGKTKEGAEGLPSRRSKEKKAKKEKRSKSARKDGGSDAKDKSKRKSKSKSKSNSRNLSLEDKGLAVTEQVAESGAADAFSGIVREERDAQVHSSQAKVKVVSLSSTR